MNHSSQPESSPVKRRLNGAGIAVTSLLAAYLVSLGPVAVYAIKHKSFNLMGYIYPMLWLRTTPLQPAVDAYLGFWKSILGEMI